MPDARCQKTEDGELRPEDRHQIAEDEESMTEA